jgi:hypothetical protein
MKALRRLLFTCVLALTTARAIAQTTVTIVATDSSAAEVELGVAANPGSIQVIRTGSTASPLTVWVKVSGIAVQGVDYTFGNNIGPSVVIPAGSSTLNIPVIPIDDWLIEGDEDVRIKVESKTASGANVPYTVDAADRAIVDIADNEDPLLPPRAVVSVIPFDPSAMETPDGTDPAIFRINRTNNLVPALSVRYALGGTATPEVDYTTPPATITIPAGVAFVDVPIAPIDDALIEDAKTVTFTLLPSDVTGVPPPPEAYAVDATTGTASATISSDDVPPPPTVTITAPGPNAAAASGHPVTVNFTASAVDGYIVSYDLLREGSTVASGLTNLPASTPAGTPFTGTGSVTFTGSNGFGYLSVRVTNSNGVSATSAVVAVYVFVAPPDPPPPPVLPIINIYPFDAEGAEVSVGSPNVASFRVTHDFPASATVSFLFAIGGTAREDVDYTLSSAGTLSSGLFGRWFTFPAGTTETEILVEPVDDLLIESAETVTMSLYTPPFIGFNEGGPNAFEPGTFGFYYGTNPSASVSILDNDTTPPPFPVITLAATDAIATETTDGSDPVVFTVTRTSGPTDVPLTVNYALTIPARTSIFITPAPAMALNGVDFPALSGTVTIPAGASSADIVVVPTYDLLSEVTEILQLTLRPSAVAWPDPAGYVLDENIVATASIHDAALAAGTPVVWIRVTDALAFEENLPGRTGSFSVERSGNLTDSLTVAYSTSGAATNGVDYVALPGTVTIPGGSPRASILIDPYLDAIAETGESVGITIEPPSPAVSPPPYVVGTSSTMQRSAGISILERFPISAKARAFHFRRQHHGIIPLPTPSAPTAGVALAAAPLIVWTVEASTDLVNWDEIGTTDPSGEYGNFVDVNAGNFDSRFYRFRPLPIAAP